MSASNFIHLEDCEIIRVTEWAVQLKCDDFTGWIPKSQISDPDVFEVGDKGVTVSITEWIAAQKGIEL